MSVLSHLTTRGSGLILSELENQESEHLSVLYKQDSDIFLTMDRLIISLFLVLLIEIQFCQDIEMIIPMLII